MAMKRTRESPEVDSLDMAKCLMLLSHNLARGTPEKQFISTTTTSGRSSNDNMFECKTCNKKFPSFQALGGHRASHKRPRLLMGLPDKESANGDDQAVIGSTKKPKKMHECSICGVEFGLGQALGGHMRRHRAAAMAQTFGSSATLKTTNHQHVVSKLPVLRRSNSKRIFGLDLNLTPLENDLQYLFGKMAPKVDLLI